MRKTVGGWRRRAKVKKVQRLISKYLDTVLANGFGAIEARQIMDDWLARIKKYYDLTDEQMNIDYEKGTVDFFIQPKRAVDFINIKMNMDEVKVE